MPNTKIKITKSKMSDEMQRDALQCAFLAVNMFDNSLDIADYIKEEFDRKHQPKWHCIVGNFANSVTNKENCYIRFSVDDESILLFKTD